jgi:hypothetical protein
VKVSVDALDHVKRHIRAISAAGMKRVTDRDLFHAHLVLQGGHNRQAS